MFTNLVLILDWIGLIVRRRVHSSDSSKVMFDIIIAHTIDIFGNPVCTHVSSYITHTRGVGQAYVSSLLVWLIPPNNVFRQSFIFEAFRRVAFKKGPRNVTTPLINVGASKKRGQMSRFFTLRHPIAPSANTLKINYQFNTIRKS